MEDVWSGVLCIEYNVKSQYKLLGILFLLLLYDQSAPRKLDEAAKSKNICEN